MIMMMPGGMAFHVKMPFKQACEAYDRYFTKYPKIKLWHKHVRHKIIETQVLVTAIGRERQFYGRVWEDHTLRQAIACGPQSHTAEIINVGLWNLWIQLELEAKALQLLGQVHDAVLGQFAEDEVLKEIIRLMTIPCPVTDIFGVTRDMTIPVEVEIGRNWGKASEENPNGMKAWRF